MRAVPEWLGRNDDSPIPDRVKDRIARKAGDCCQKCQRPIMGKLRAEFDHVTPLCLGGEHREGNIQLLCSDCHKAKSALDAKLKAKITHVRKKLVLGLKKPRTILGWKRFNGDPVRAGRER